MMQAYKEWVKRNGEEPQLPAVNFTNEQLFFISAAQVRCYSKILATVTRRNGGLAKIFKRGRAGVVKHCPSKSSYFQFLFWQLECFGLLNAHFCAFFTKHQASHHFYKFSVIIGRHVYKISSPNDGNAENDT